MDISVFRYRYDANIEKIDYALKDFINEKDIAVDNFFSVLDEVIDFAKAETFIYILKEANARLYNDLRITISYKEMQDVKNLLIKSKEKMEKTLIETNESIIKKNFLIDEYENGIKENEYIMSSLMKNSDLYEKDSLSMFLNVYSRSAKSFVKQNEISNEIDIEGINYDYKFKKFHGIIPVEINYDLKFELIIPMKTKHFNCRFDNLPVDCKVDYVMINEELVGISIRGKLNEDETNKNIIIESDKEKIEIKFIKKFNDFYHRIYFGKYPFIRDIQDVISSSERVALCRDLNNLNKIIFYEVKELYEDGNKEKIKKESFLLFLFNRLKDQIKTNDDEKSFEKIIEKLEAKIEERLSEENSNFFDESQKMKIMNFYFCSEKHFNSIVNEIVNINKKILKLEDILRKNDSEMQIIISETKSLMEVNQEAVSKMSTLEIKIPSNA